MGIWDVLQAQVPFDQKDCNFLHYSDGAKFLAFVNVYLIFSDLEVFISIIALDYKQKFQNSLKANSGENQSQFGNYILFCFYFDI